MPPDGRSLAHQIFHSCGGIGSCSGQKPWLAKMWVMEVRLGIEEKQLDKTPPQVAVQGTSKEPKQVAAGSSAKSCQVTLAAAVYRLAPSIV